MVLLSGMEQEARAVMSGHGGAWLLAEEAGGEDGGWDQQSNSSSRVYSVESGIGSAAWCRRLCM